MSSRTIQLTPRTYEYLLSHVFPESRVVAELREFTHAQVPMFVMQISPEQGAFMALLVRMLGVKKAIEIGTFTGYSALVIAEALPEDGVLVACDVSDEWTSIARRFWTKADVAHKIDLRLQPAANTLEELVNSGQSGSFDFAFVDADKLNYDLYYEFCLRLLRPGGVMGIDNTLWSGRVADASTNDGSTIRIRELNDKISSDSRVAASILPISDGLTLVLKL